MFCLLLLVLPGNIYSSNTLSITLLPDMMLYSQNGSTFVRGVNWTEASIRLTVIVDRSQLFIFGLVGCQEKVLLCKAKGLKEGDPFKKQPESLI